MDGQMGEQMDGWVGRGKGSMWMCVLYDILLVSCSTSTRTAGKQAGGKGMVGRLGG